jgi:hypothetical protein
MVAEAELPLAVHSSGGRRRKIGRSMERADKQPAIARIWRGRTTRQRADEYEVYNYEVGIKPLIEKALGVQTLREDREHETEFTTISWWEDVEAMASFTGGDPTRIHHLPRDAEFLIELPDRVHILRLLTSHGRTG